MLPELQPFLNKATHFKGVNSYNEREHTVFIEERAVSVSMGQVFFFSSPYVRRPEGTSAFRANNGNL